jgi:hypothetical protein
MALTIINIDLLNSFVKEVKEVHSDYQVFIVLVDTLENKEERLEINKENECAIQEFFEEKFHQNIEQRRYAYRLSLSFFSSTPVAEGINHQEVLNAQMESVNKIKQKYNI